MKDQYVADINDYVKYAFLRALTSTADLVVAWMLTPSDARRDGQRLAYLHRPAVFRGLDPPLFDLMEALVRSDRRTVGAVEKSQILGDTAYVSNVLDDGVAARGAYFERLHRLSVGRRTVFFDPDNGLEVTSVPRGRRFSSKYLYWEEAAATFREGHSLVVYQHFPRRPRQAFLEAAFERARSELGCGMVLALRTPHTALLVIPQSRDADHMASCVADFSRRAAPLVAGFTRFEDRP